MAVEIPQFENLPSKATPVTADRLNAWGAAIKGNAEAVETALASVAHSLATPADPDAGAIINAELAALSTAGGGRLQLGAGRLTIVTPIAVPTGCELAGLGPRVTELYTATDIPAIAWRGGSAQGVRSLKIQNATTGARTTYDIDVTNPTKPVIEDVEIANTPTASGLGGIRLLGTDLLTGENAFMPQLSRVWIRGGRLVIVGVTDGHVTDSYVWATERTGGGAIDMSEAADGWTFATVDVVPPIGDGAGYLLTNVNNTNFVGGYIDGSYADVATGYGIRAVNSGRLFVAAYRFYNLGRSGVHLTNTHGCSIGKTGFFNCNKNDDSYPDIDLYASTGNTFEGNVHTCYDPRTLGGYTYREDATSTTNSVDNNVMDRSLGGTYASPYQSGAVSTFGPRNRPGPYWARPGGARGSIVPPASLLTLPTAAAGWPAANAAIFHRFTVEVGALYRYGKVKCSTPGGNVQMVVLALSGGASSTTYTRVMNTGVISLSAGNLSLDMGATFLPAGDYAIGLWATTTSATFWHGVNAGIPVMQMTAKVTSGLEAGIPASGTLTWDGDRYVSAMALSYT